MIKHFIYTFLTLIVLTSCTKYIDFSPKYEGDKMVVNGFISTSEGVKIKITHSINPVGKYLYADSLLVEDAAVTLYENGAKLAEIAYSGKGFYSFPNAKELNISEGKKYKVLVQSTLYGNVESEEVAISKSPVVTDLSFVQSGTIDGLFSFTIKEPNNLDSYFYIELIGPGNMYYYFKEYKNDEGNFYFESCKASVGHQNHIFLYSNYCGFTNTQHKYLIQTKSYDGTFYNDMVVNLGTVGQEFYEYAKSYNDLNGLDYGFAEPPILKSNIKGGYGLFYAKNTIIFPIPSSK